MEMGPGERTWAGESILKRGSGQSNLGWGIDPVEGLRRIELGERALGERTWAGGSNLARGSWLGDGTWKGDQGWEIEPGEGFRAG